MAYPIAKSEVQRKLFHSLMILVAVVNWFGVQFYGPSYGPLLSIGFTGICLVFFLGFEITRIRVHGYFPFKQITDRVMRPRERTRLGASVYFAVGTLFAFLSLYLISNILFRWYQLECPWMLSGWLAVSAVLVSAVGDGAAALIGMKFGRRRLKGNRTVEGAIGGFVFGFLGFIPLWYIVGIHWFYGLLAATILFLVDLIGLPGDDNLINPIAIGLTLALFEVILILISSMVVG